MKKVLILTITAIILLFSLAACTASGDAPEGLQLGYESKDGGFIFYAPENWALVNTPEVVGAKVSAINNTSITFTEAKMPEHSIPEYFESSLSEFPESIKSTMTIHSRDEKCLFGNASSDAYKYVYTYKYEEYDFACMQILLINDGSFYIFTYTSYGDVNDDGSYYNLYLEVVQLAIDSFKFTERSGEASEVTYEKDADGYNLVSNEEISGFKLYLPEDYEVVYSDAFVKAKISDGANLSLSKATQTGLNIISYLENRKAELGRFTEDFKDIGIYVGSEIDTSGEAYKDFPFTTLPEYNESLKFGNLERGSILAYEYEYTFNNEVYKVYQVMGVDTFSGYVFTYTALSDEYDEHIDEIKTVLGKVEF